MGRARVLEFASRNGQQWVQQVSREEVLLMPLKRSKPLPVQCKATTSSGDRCRAKPHKNGLCFFHSDPEKAAELGRKGGRRNRHTYQTPLQLISAPESAGDVKRMLAESMVEIRAGKMDPSSAARSAISGWRCYGPSRLPRSSSGSNDWSRKNELENQAE